MRLLQNPISALPFLLPCILLLPLLFPGQLIFRDMVVLDHPALSLGAFGFGDLPARNAPQDGALAIIGALLPASWIARGAILGAAMWGCFHLRNYPAALVLLLVNPYVIERLLQGQWSLVIAAWLLPIVATPSVSTQRVLALWACSLTPTGCIAAIATALVTGTGRIRMILAGILCGLPWLTPSLLSSHGEVHGAYAFAARAETYVGTLGAVLGLGGIWNAQSVPASRHMGFALAGIALFALLLTAFQNIDRRLCLLAGVGFILALLGWMMPSVVAALLHFPGGGLLRDGQKWLVLAIPAFVFLAQHAKPTWLLISLTLLQIPDAPASLWQLKPTAGVIQSYGNGQDVLFTDLPPTLDPRTKASPSVESGALQVDGVLIDAPSPRYSAAVLAWQQQDFQKLQELKVGIIVDDGTITQIPEVQPRYGWQWWTGFALSLLWLLFPIMLLPRVLWHPKNNHSPPPEQRTEHR